MNAREKRIAGVTAAVVGAGLLWVLGLEPAWAAWTREGDRLTSLQELVRRERELQAELKGLREQRQVLAERLSPGHAEGAIAGFAAFVRGLSRGAGFEPASLRFVRAQALVEPGEAAPASRSAAAAAAPRGSPFAELRFELRARTSLKALHEFLLKLAASERPVRVVTLGISPRSDGPDLDVDMSLLALAPREALREELPGQESSR